VFCGFLLKLPVPFTASWQSRYTLLTTHAQSKENKSMKEQVQEVLELIRPALQADGGDVELVDVTDDGIVSVRLTGACGSCPMSTMTLKMGIERTLVEKIPDVKEVVQV
jgi:Fe-S cluster biogenesis protein NfuA